MMSMMSRQPPRRISQVALFAASLRLLALLASLVAPPALADLSDLTFLNPIEAAAASANQATYNQLLQVCDPNALAPSGQCTGAVFDTFSNVRELVDTANELTGQGPTRFSLGLDQEGLGFALRWTAAEELAAQGASATQFANSQLGALASRLSALRFGTRGFRVANRDSSQPAVLAKNGQPMLGGGASADEESIASLWGAFIDGSFGYGNKDDTSFAGGAEDAFDFDGQEVTLGVDRRISDSFVIGVIAGHTDKAIDFNSSESIVDARIDISGYSTMLYALWEAEHLYLNGSLGGQWLDLDMRRRITYPSLNPIVPSTDATATSTTSSNAITATFGVGYDARWKALQFGPYLQADYQDITIDGFNEGGADADSFNLHVGSQDIKSLDTAVGLRLQYVLTPSFGVIVPYVRGEYHHEFENDARVVSAAYADVATTGAGNFALRTDKPDDSYTQATAGVSVVLAHGLQGYLQYQQVFSLDTYSDRVITGGARYEF